jgi:hypothetical protein
METFDLLDYAARAFDRLNLRYFVTGSVATIYFGEPRFTNDIDIVVDLPAGIAAELAAAFPAPEFYLEPESILRAQARGSQFNIIHPASGLKIDVMVPALDAFNASRFHRRRPIRLPSGRDADFASPEDVILKKLHFYREGGSDKHLRDIAGMIKVLGSEQVDWRYLEEWIRKLDLDELWQRVRDQVTEPT